MQLRDVIRRRRMVRAYDPARPVPRDVIDDLLELAIRAPSAGYTQGWRFLVLDTASARDSFWAATAELDPPTKPGASPEPSVSTKPGAPPKRTADPWLAGLRTAPVLIVVFSDKEAYLDRYAEPDKGWTNRDESRWPVPYWHVDAGMAALLILLGAVDSGLASCFFGVPGDRWDALRSAFAVPAVLTPVGVVSVGYGAPDRRSPSLRRGRRSVAEVTRYASFG
jgi:nitroreductase